jgi:hypothetical protein
VFAGFKANRINAAAGTGLAAQIMDECVDKVIVRRETGGSTRSRNPAKLRACTGSSCAVGHHEGVAEIETFL